MARIRGYCAALLAALILLLYSGAASADGDAGALQAEQLYAESALLIDADTGEALFSKNARVRMYPASTTKIMTLLLALESDVALDTVVTIPPEAADIPEGSSVIPVQPGDAMRFEDLLYAFMLTSGNDGANAIAVLTDGGIDAFVARMNARAAELGCEGTHFVNAHGYHDPDHYTTARDLAVISRAAMENPAFRAIVAAPAWSAEVRRGGETRTGSVISRNSLLQSDSEFYYADCTGIKTGHHSRAGWCFVGSAARDGVRLIGVVLNCAEENQKWLDAARLFEYGFAQYEPVTASTLLQRARERFAEVRVEGAEATDPTGGRLLLDLAGVTGGEQTFPARRDAVDAALDRLAEGVRVEWTRALEAPVTEGETLGYLTYDSPEGWTATAALTAPRAVAAQPAAAPAATSAPSGTGAGRSLPVVALLVPLALALMLAAALLGMSAARRRRAARRRPRRRVLR